jgi:hypothetical protein
MPLNPLRARDQLAKGNLRALFIEELGWDRHAATLKVTVEGSTLVLEALAQKRGMIAYQCPTPPGERLPDYSRRRKIEHQVAKSAHEHLIVFTDATNETQVWQWVKREPGKPAGCREHRLDRSQPGDALLQKLSAIAFTLEEEDSLSLPDVTRRARAGFDVERVTKRFYERFQKEHAAFLKFITGITETADREWYVSVMLNRLMFVYFVQRKGFLDGDRDYLRNRLTRMRAEHGKDKFYSFYRYFLLRLFHEGLGGKARTRELEKLVGRIPYLNGGLFDVHELEKPDRYGKTIQIPDEAFERVFDYFDQYHWHLDERPLRADNEINPDVLGYIFEKYINQKQMGAYYTKEDITEYISKYTVLPFLFDTARAKCKVAFENPKGPTVWDLLSEDPDRYIYPAVRHGAEQVLPPEIVAGLQPPTLHKVVSDGQVQTLDLRKDWNKPAPATHALPTETWREVIARRARFEEIKAKLAAGAVRDINDLITLNLDIRQFAQDAIENCEGPDLLRAFWHAIEKVTILDPTCGSGAFLFAALNILEPLYEACLDRMEGFVEDLARSGEKHRPEKYSDFRKVLERVAAHPNRRYFIFKSIVLNNLFGVDIMEEAVEICKLRLFLKLAAQVEPDATRANLGIEPLPDIDFNIRAGNTLVGYANLDGVKQAMASKLDFDNAAEKVAVKAADLQQASDSFRARQSEGDGSVPTEHKQELRRRLKALDDELNTHLATEYGVAPSKKDAFARWVKSHQPFHWFVEFYGIMQAGGFDVVIGNPPYVSAAKVKKEYDVKTLATRSCPDIYAWVLERGLSLLRDNGRSGMITPLSLGFSGDFAPIRDLLFASNSQNWFSSFGRIPSALFSFDVRVRNTIHLAKKARGPQANYTTRLHRWFEVERDTLFERLAYAQFQQALWKGRVPKLNTQGLTNAFEKLLASTSRPLMAHTSPRPTRYVLHFKKTAYNWLNFCRELPPCFEDGRRVEHTKFGKIHFPDEATCELALLLANGKLMLAFWFAVADDFDVTLWNFGDFPADVTRLPERARSRLLALVAPLERSMKDALQFKLNAGRRVGNYNLGKCRHITDRSDAILAEAFGLLESWEDVELYYTQTVRTDFSADEGEE